MIDVFRLQGPRQLVFSDKVYFRDQEERLRLEVPRKEAFTLSDFLMGRDADYPLTTELKINAMETLRRINLIKDKYPGDLLISSGYRPGKYNAWAKGAKNSLHKVCRAVDFVDDKKKKFSKFCLFNQDLLVEIGLWMENPLATPNHCHLQTKAPKSGVRIFNP